MAARTYQLETELSNGQKIVAGTFTVTDGVNGANGADGADGITPTIGENGNWFLGATDTGKPSRGEQGAQGERGEQGAQGAQGVAGKDGANGVSVTKVTLVEV